MGGDEPGALGTLLSGDDGPSAVGLGGQGLSVPGGALLGVGPHRPPRPRILDRVPDGLSPDSLVPLAPRAPLGGDGVNELPISEGVPAPVEVGLQVARGPGSAGPDNEPQLRLIQGRQVGGREHAGISDDHELLDAVGGLEGLHDGDDGGGLGLVSFPAPDSQRETTAVDQQADDDLGIDPPLLGVTHPPQVVLLLGLEIERGDVVQAQGQTPTSVGDVLEQGV